MTPYESRDNPWVSIWIGVGAASLFAIAFALAGCGPTRPTKDAVRGSHGPALPAHDDAPDVCVGPECAIPPVPQPK